MKKLFTIMFLFLTLTSPVFGNSDELILICKDKLKTGAEGKYYDKEVSYKLQSFVVKLNKKKKDSWVKRLRIRYYTIFARI